MIKHYLKLLWKRRTKNAFLFAELILVFWILIAVFAFGFTKAKYYSTPLGFDWQNVYRLQLNFDMEADTVQSKRMVEAVKKEIENLPEVESAAYSIGVAPYWGNNWANSNDHDGFNFSTDYILTDADYAEVWNIKLKSGRFYTKEEFDNKYLPVVATQKFVDEFLKDKEPLGFRFRFWDNQWVEIIGVAENFKYQGDFSEEKPFLLVPSARWREAINLLNFRIKPGTPPSVEKKINNLVERTIKSSDFDIIRIEDSRKAENRSSYIPLVGLTLLALFLIINIAMGLFGILRYSIANRIPEIGLRKVIGATGANIRKQFTGEMIVLAVLAFLVAFIFAVQIPFITDIPVSKEVYFLSVAASAALIFVIVFLCSIFPSNQAAKILPATALHEE